MTLPKRGAGRKPMPTELLKVRGSFNVTRHGKGRQFEPKPVGDLAEPPPDLTETQEDVWRYAVRHMPPGLLKLIDRDMLMIWCEARDRWNTARLMQAMIDRDASLKLLVKGPMGLQPSPYNDILEKTAKTMIRVAQELGFSPAARPRLKVDAPPTIDGDEVDPRRDPWALLETIPGQAN